MTPYVKSTPNEERIKLLSITMESNIVNPQTSLSIIGLKCSSSFATELLFFRRKYFAFFPAFKTDEADKQIHKKHKVDKET